MANTTLKVLTKKVDIKGKLFVLVKITRTDDGHEFFGTIPYEELDDKGCMKRELNGLEMCLRDTIGEALDQRLDMINTEGMNMDQMVEYFKSKLQCQKRA